MLSCFENSVPKGPEVAFPGLLELQRPRRKRPVGEKGTWEGEIGKARRTGGFARNLRVVQWLMVIRAYFDNELAKLSLSSSRKYHLTGHGCDRAQRQGRLIEDLDYRDEIPRLQG